MSSSSRPVFGALRHPNVLPVAVFHAGFAMHAVVACLCVMLPDLPVMACLGDLLVIHVSRSLFGSRFRQWWRCWLFRGSGAVAALLLGAMARLGRLATCHRETRHCQKQHAGNQAAHGKRSLRDILTDFETMPARIRLKFSVIVNSTESPRHVSAKQTPQSASITARQQSHDNCG
ncbi:MAG: hypothetical protein JO056_14100 [Alphaproteobacteria bacterium]|nr:hypothetical protein [Alphaproteobacteria bacterium]